jgi:serine phosphatase RsbU (regulator of sigma subunit)
VHSVDGSLAGRAYQRSEVVVSDVDDGGGRIVWAPILDGTARMGVLCTRIAKVDAIALGRARQLAGAVASLLVAKSAYGDGLVRASYARTPTLAASIRMSTLPPLAFEHGPIALGAVLEPAYEIAGDTFDYAIDADVLHVAIFDAMGHGLRASQLASLAVSAYRWARRDRRPLPEIYRAVDEVVAMEFGPDSFVTAQLATIELATGAVECVNAGHPAPLLLRDGKVGELSFATCLPIGLGHGDGEVATSSLQPDDTVVFVSDGTIEARSASGEQFGIDRLGEHLQRADATGLTPSETMRRAAHAILDHHGGRLDDDATLVSVTWNGERRD